MDLEKCLASKNSCLAKGGGGWFFEVDREQFLAEGHLDLLEVTFSPRRQALSAHSATGDLEHRPQALPSSGRWPKAIAFAQLADHGGREVEALEGGTPGKSARRP